MYLWADSMLRTVIVTVGSVLIPGLSKQEVSSTGVRITLAEYFNVIGGPQSSESNLEMAGPPGGIRPPDSYSGCMVLWTTPNPVHKIPPTGRRGPEPVS